MAVEIPYRRQLEFEYGQVATIAPGIRRVIANNPGPFTFHGTGTYILGTGKVAVVDPGPDDQAHIDAILGALEGETITDMSLRGGDDFFCWFRTCKRCNSAVKVLPFALQRRRWRQGNIIIEDRLF